MADQPAPATGTPHSDLPSTSQPPRGEPTSGFHPTHHEGARYHDLAIKPDNPNYAPPHYNDNQFPSTSTGPNNHAQSNHDYFQPHHNYNGYPHPMYRADSIPTAIPSYLRPYPNPNYPFDIRAASPARNHWELGPDGQYRYRREEAYIQEIHSDADIADLEALPSPPLPKGADPPPAPISRARELTAHASDFERTTSPEAMGFFSRRRTSSSMGSLLRSGPASPRPVFDQETATAQLADMLDQPRRRNDAANTPFRSTRPYREHSGTPPPASPGQSQSGSNPAARRWPNSRLRSGLASARPPQSLNVSESLSVPLRQPMGPPPPPDQPQSGALPAESGRTAWARPSQAPPGVAPVQQFPATGYNTYPAEHLPPTAPAREERFPLTTHPTLLATPHEAQHEARPLGNRPTVMVYPSTSVLDANSLPPLSATGYPAIHNLAPEPSAPHQHQPFPTLDSLPTEPSPPQSPRGPRTFGPNGNTLPPLPSFAMGHPTFNTLASEPSAPRQHQPMTPMTPEFAQRSSPPHGQREHSPSRESEAGPSRRPHMEETRARRQSGKGKGRADPAPSLGVPQYQSTPPPSQHAHERLPDLPSDVLKRCMRMIEGTLSSVDWLVRHFTQSERDGPNNLNAMMARRVKEITMSLQDVLATRPAFIIEHQRLMTERWHEKHDSRCDSLFRTLQGFERFTDTVYSRTALRIPSINTLSKCSAKLSEFDAKFSDLQSKFTSLYNRMRLRILHDNLRRATDSAANQLRRAQSRRDLPAWEAGKRHRAQLRREFVDFRNSIANARRTSLHS